ncbi:hypothetical protein C8J56DRAFT_879604 [Mycena floridula]|nr:hypothetical protein C8J56DRAFT_879604 [Mycena floridula]
MDFAPPNLDIWIETALAIVRLHYFCELPFNEIDDDVANIICYAVPASDAAIAWTFSDVIDSCVRIRTRYNLDWMFSQLAQATINAGIDTSVVHVSTDGYGSDDNDDNTDEEMPPLADLSDWDTDSRYSTDDSSW